MTDDSLLPFYLPSVQRKKVCAAFDGGVISSDGGLVLLHEAELGEDGPTGAGSVGRFERVFVASPGGPQAGSLHGIIDARIEEFPTLLDNTGCRPHPPRHRSAPCRSASSMLPPGGRLVTIVSANCVPGDAAWTDTFGRIDPPARCVFTMAIDGRAGQAHCGSEGLASNGGTTLPVALVVASRPAFPIAPVNPV